MAVNSSAVKAEPNQEEISKALLKQATHSDTRSRNPSLSPEKSVSNGEAEAAAQPLQFESAIEEQDDVDDLKSSAVFGDPGYNRKLSTALAAVSFFLEVY